MPALATRTPFVLFRVTACWNCMMRWPPRRCRTHAPSPSPTSCKTSSYAYFIKIPVTASQPQRCTLLCGRVCYHRLSCRAAPQDPALTHQCPPLKRILLLPLLPAVQVMQHPWVSGSAWHVLLPDLSRSPAASDTDGERAGSIGQPSPASFNAEVCPHDFQLVATPIPVGRPARTGGSALLVCDMPICLPRYWLQEVAAVVFPEMHAELGPAGGSPRSPGGSRTQLVDALAAATMAAGDDDMACRLARSPRSRLHNLAEDSMIERSWDQQGSSGGPSSVAEADRGPASADGDAQPPVAPISQVAPIPQAAMAAAEAQLDSSASAGNGSQGAGEVRGDIMMDMERVEFNLLEQQQEQETLASWQWTEQQEQPMLGQKQSADEPLPPIPFGVTNLASSSFMQEAQRGTLGDGQLPGSQEKQQQDDTSSANFGSDIKSRESPIHGLARASPAGGAASSTARRVRAKRLDTLRSFFAGPADFVVGALPQEHQHYSHKPPPLPGAPAPRRSLASGLFAGPADVVKGAEEVLPAGARVPPRAPPPRPTSQQPVVVNIFKVGWLLMVDFCFLCLGRGGGGGAEWVQ